MINYPHPFINFPWTLSKGIGWRHNQKEKASKGLGLGVRSDLGWAIWGVLTTALQQKGG